MSPTGESYSFRSCVRASEAACGRETTLLPMLGFGRKQRAATCVVSRALPFAVAKPLPCRMLAYESLQIAANRF